jgi:hypothetical protein
VAVGSDNDTRGIVANPLVGTAGEGVELSDGKRKTMGPFSVG